ncbi:hypothetical protein BHE74_00006612 [Ensete ventricosum]|nr:hypothetical protein GW17_00022207 [Ensete ventricosum]RWW84759.1 hypothetical protein BHE74_00006612 [Ensete ventricosum]RZR83516.1 hypothetical protein BHM03_00010130 [Ensete ventricosum]
MMQYLILPFSMDQPSSTSKVCVILEVLSSSVSYLCCGVMRSQDIHTPGFLEVGAAGLLVGDIETKIKDHSWMYSLIVIFFRANIPVSTFHPRVRPLFQYRHYRY